MSRRVANWSSLTTILLGTLSCGGGGAGTGTPEAIISSVTVTPGAGSVEVGATTQFSATLKNASGVVVTGRAIRWTSSNTTVATVSDAGMVKGVAPGGPASIAAASEGQSGVAPIIVTAAAVSTVAVTPDSALLGQGTTRQLTATPRDARGVALSTRSVTWASSNTAVVTVSTSGLVTAVAAGGTATVTATSEGKDGTARVAVFCCEYETPNSYPSGVSASFTVHDAGNRDVLVRVRVPVSAQLPLPVVLLSPPGDVTAPGTFGLGQRWGQVLAEAGFAVILLSAPAIPNDAYCAELHVPSSECETQDFDSEVANGGTLPAIWVARARDASAVLNQLAFVATQISLPLDSSRVAVAGWSGGAHTVMLLSGARVDLSPTVKGVSFRDARFLAYLATSPPGIGTLGLTSSSWNSVAKPVMTQTGDNDVAAVLPWNSRDSFTRMPSGDKYEAYFESPEAGHLAFGLIFGGPLEAFIARNGVAFFDAYVRGLSAARTWLSTNQLAGWSLGVARMSTK